MNSRPYLRYTAIAIGYTAGIFILSAIPGQDGEQVVPIPDLLWNLLHIPLFSGLTWCLLMSLSDWHWSRTVPPSLYGIIWLLAAVYAVLDEWHQSFVVGRSANVGDFLLDCTGAAELLLIHRLVSSHGETSPTISSS